MRKVTLTAAVGLLALSLVGCADTTVSDGGSTPGADSESGEKEFSESVGDISPYCGDEPVKVAYAKGSDNAWSQMVFAELQDEAAKCENITEVRYVEAQGSQERAIADINSLVAQGFNIIIAQPEFGEAQLPSLRAAEQAGATVVSLISNPGGQPGTDYAYFVDADKELLGERQAKWLSETVGSGTVVFLGGTPGAASSKKFYDTFAAALAEYPDLTLVEERPVDTDWDAGKKKQVMSALLAKHGRIDAVVSDYGATDTGAIDAYIEAGMEPPALATNASGNGIGCMWEETNFPYFSIDGDTAQIRLALRLALADYQGIETEETPTVDLPVYVDSESGKEPLCDPSLPDDATLYSTLDQETIAALFK